MISGMAQTPHPAKAISEAAHITANNHPGAPAYDASAITDMLEEMIDHAPELKEIAAPILVSK